MNNIISFTETKKNKELSSQDKKIQTLSNKQREHFFKRRIVEIRKEIDFSEIEENTLFKLLLAAEHPYYSNNKKHYILNEVQNLDDKKELISPEIDWFLATLKYIWSSVWREHQENNAALFSARFVLKRQKKFENDEVTDYHDALRILEAEIKKHLPKAKKEIGLPVDISEIDNLSTDKNGYFYLDGKAIDFLEKNNRGLGTKNILAGFKSEKNPTPKKLDERRRVWDRPLFFQRALGAALWGNYAREIVKESKIRPAALVQPVFSSLRNSMTKGSWVDSKQEFLLSSEGRKIARIRTPAISIATAKMMKTAEFSHLQSVVAHKIIRWTILEVHNRFLQGIQDPRLITIEGGYEELGNLSGAGTSSKTVMKIKKVLLAQEKLKFKVTNENGSPNWGQMLTVNHSSASGRNKKSRIELLVNTILCPNFSRTLPQGSYELREQRKLIPIVRLPNLIGRLNDHTSQINFHMEIILEMRKGAKNLVLNGGILLPPEKLEQIASRVKMPKSLIKRVLECWLENNILEKIDTHIYSLGKKDPNALAMLKEAGEKEIQAKEKAFKRRKKPKKKV